MRRSIALLLIGLVASASQAENKFNTLTTPGKLPKDVFPRSYHVDLEPNIETLVTEGFETIVIDVLKSTDHIVLNAVDTEISSATVSSGDRIEALNPRFDLNQQTVSFESTHTLEPGRYTLSFRFQSRISRQPHGLFIQHFDSHGILEPILATEFEPCDADACSRVGMNRYSRPFFN